jgi:1-acyl-sn-glycerol-3-phosphate acyltransferase
MGRERIERYSTRYAILKSIAGFWQNNVFYRKVIVLGQDNISPDDHVIFAPNHQNALMDALAVLFTQKGQPVFLARADIFKKKLIASLLYFLKILPVYRIRDGFASLKGNDEIFNKTVDVLKNRNGLVILPEGDHAGFRRLRQLKKGICRVAFQADEATDFRLRIKIVPVGLEFTNYSSYREVLTVVYGKPIEVADYHEEYRENPEKALNKLRNRLSLEMKKVMVHIDSEEDYEAIDELRSIINGRFSDDTRTPKIFRDRALIEKMNRLRTSDPALYRKICDLSLRIKKEAAGLKLSYILLDRKKHPLLRLIAGAIALVIGFPFFLYGNIFNLTFLEIPSLQTKKIRDTQFHSTMRYGISFALALILLPVFLILSFIIFPNWLIAIPVFLSLPLSGLFAWNYFQFFRRIRAGFRIRKFANERNATFDALQNDYGELKGFIAGLKNE